MPKFKIDRKCKRCLVHKCVTEFGKRKRICFRCEEKDVGDMLVFIVDNKDKNRSHLIADKIFETCKKLGIENVIENLKDRSKTPLILWTIDVISEGIKNGK